MNYYNLISMMPKAVAYDADAQLFITATGISGTNASAINTLVLDLKAANIWTKMKALYPMVGGTATAHKFNLKNPLDTDAAFRLVFNGGWTHSANGALPNGTNAYADTFLIPSTSLSLNNVHISIYINANSAINGPSISSENASTYNNGLYIWPRIATATPDVYSVRVNDNTSQQGSSTDSRGFHIALRNAVNQKKYIKNNSTLFSTTTTSTALNTSSVYLSKSRNNATYGNFLTAFASIGDGLTDAEALSFYNAVQTFQTTLGRQV
jgi:hypothetical protein